MNETQRTLHDNSDHNTFICTMHNAIIKLEKDNNN